MECSKCGSTIEEGKLYCPDCGAVVNLVPDYSVLDEEILPTFVEDPKITAERIEQEKNAKMLQDDLTDMTQEEESLTDTIKSSVKNSKKIRVSMITIAVLILGVVLISISLYQNSYRKQFNLGKKCDKTENYDSAITHYLVALEKDPSSVEARLAASTDYMQLLEYDSAIRLLKQVIALDPTCSDAYFMLIQIYSAENNVDALRFLRESAVTKDVQDYLDEFMSNVVSYSLEGGTYSDDLELELSTEGDGDIIFTTDGSMPSALNGEVYEEPIQLKTGKTEVNAILVRDGNNAGMMASELYDISYEKPELPTITPMSGTYRVDTMITITSQKEGDKIYYTWDNSIPTVSSNLYTEPISMIEGDNVLSVIVIDSHNMASDIVKMNYRYLP